MDSLTDRKMNVFTRLIVTRCQNLKQLFPLKKKTRKFIKAFIFCRTLWQHSPDKTMRGIIRSVERGLHFSDVWRLVVSFVLRHWDFCFSHCSGVRVFCSNAWISFSSSARHVFTILMRQHAHDYTCTIACTRRHICVHDLGFLVHCFPVRSLQTLFDHRCSPDLETLSVTQKPFHSTTELTAMLIMAVYIPHCQQ